MKTRPLLIFVIAAITVLAIANYGISQSTTVGPQTSAAMPNTSVVNGHPGQNENLPESASTLPLLTIIGAGVLIGGLFSARKTRPVRQTLSR